MSRRSALANEMIRGQYKNAIIIFLVISAASQWYGWNNAPKSLRTVCPPDLRSLVMQKAGKIAPHEPFYFAKYFFQKLNTWENNGKEDYLNNIRGYRRYYTPQYYHDLLADYNTKKHAGELTDRIRTFEHLTGEYEEKHVEIRKGYWIVWLDVKIEDTMLGQPVKTLVLRYPIKVVQTTDALDHNPFAMRLHGYAEEPRKILTAKDSVGDAAT